MVLKRAWPAAAGAIILGAMVLSGPAAAQQYRPGEFLTLDLSKAVLSPKPLGPATGFTPGPLDVTIDRGNNVTQTSAKLVAEPRDVAPPQPSMPRRSPTLKPRSRPEPPVCARRMRAPSGRRHISRGPLVALHGRNPVEARAQDTGTRVRIQTWPCKSGGICDWKR